MAFSHKRIFLIPLDNRPVCYDMPLQLAASAGIDLSVPSPTLLGQLKKPANFKTLTRWVKNHLFENDPLIVALDTIAYGGLIPSRVNEEPEEVLESRIADFFKQLKVDACFGFSSILRIPNYNFSEEEPEYWDQYGQQLYQYSAKAHELGAPPVTNIPATVLTDFLNRREKNFNLNLGYLSSLKCGQLDYLTYCQDDTGAYGLNVSEAEQLAEQIKTQQLTGSAHIQTGADEVASCMFARWMVLQHPKPVTVYPFYSSDVGRQVIAKFDGLPIEQVVNKAVQACGAVVAKKPADADLWLMVHTPKKKQGDHCSLAQAQTQPDQIVAMSQVMAQALELGKPLSIADVAYANGGDPRLMEKLLVQFDDWTGLYGYAGWNTPGNSIGTAIAMGLVRLMAEANRSFNAAAFCRLMLIRLADDWLYQADIRQTIRSGMNGSAQTVAPDENLLNLLMADGLFLLKSRLGLENTVIQCRYPCHRTFEIEVGVR